MSEYLTQQDLKKIKELYGDFCSFAVWNNNYKNPKDNVGDITFFNDEKIIDKLNPIYIFVGLNVSGKIEEKFSNFHSKSKNANDFKIRYALQNTILEGAYMTDIIKDHEEKDSKNVIKYIRRNPDFLEKKLEQFNTEIQLLKTENPVFIAFGTVTYKILSKKYKNVYKLTHYSHFISKEKYKKEVEELIRKLDK